MFLSGKNPGWGSLEAPICLDGHEGSPTIVGGPGPPPGKCLGGPGKHFCQENSDAGSKSRTTKDAEVSVLQEGPELEGDTHISAGVGWTAA